MKNKQEKQDHLNGWHTHTTANAAASPTFLPGRSVSLWPFHVLRLRILDTCGELFLVLRHAELDSISNREVTKTGSCRFEVLTAPLLTIQVFWDVTLCSSVSGCRRCKGKLSKNVDSLPLKDEVNRILRHVTTHHPMTERQIPQDLKPQHRKSTSNAIMRPVQILPSQAWTNEALLDLECFLGLYGWDVPSYAYLVNERDIIFLVLIPQTRSKR